MHDKRETAAVGKRGSHASLDDELGVLLPEPGEQISREKEKHANFGAVRWARARKEEAGPRLGVGPELLAGACAVGGENRLGFGLPVSGCAWACKRGPNGPKFGLLGPIKKIKIKMKQR